MNIYYTGVSGVSGDDSKWSRDHEQDHIVMVNRKQSFRKEPLWLNHQVPRDNRELTIAEDLWDIKGSGDMSKS